MDGWQTDKRIFTTQKITQGLRLVLREIAYSTSIHSSQCIFHCFLQYIFRKRNVRNLRHCFEFHECIKCTTGVESTCALCKNGKNWFHTGLTHPFRWMSGKSKKVTAAGRGPFPFLTYLGRSKGLCSQGGLHQKNNLNYSRLLQSVAHSQERNRSKHKEINYRTTHFFSCFQSILFSYNIKN